VTVLTLVVILVLYRRLLFTTFDPEVAPFYGVSTASVDTLFSLILAATIVVSMQVMGVTLIAAALVIPPSAARLLTSDFVRLSILSVVIGVFCGFFGMYISYYVDVSSGANIVLFSAAVFVAALIWSGLRARLAGVQRVEQGAVVRLEDPT
jgi:manganese/iron transport system permease protein/iron/zinc/copper transport system permease protein